MEMKVEARMRVRVKREGSRVDEKKYGSIHRHGFFKSENNIF
jgi:hypothetical protein